jgi:hypothetical protein
MTRSTASPSWTRDQLIAMLDATILAAQRPSDDHRP